MTGLLRTCSAVVLLTSLLGATLGCSQRARSGAIETVSSPEEIILFLVVPEGGQEGASFGCNDRLTPLALSPRPSAQDPVEAALTALLHYQGSEGLYNALAGQPLAVSSVRHAGKRLIVHLEGELHPSGVCDLPRLEEQLRQTALTAAGAEEVSFFINGRPLADSLSLQ